MLSEITQEASLIGTICEQGPAGEDGKTPIKGVDYWTQADKDEIVQEVSKKVDTSFIVTATTSSLSATTAIIDKTLAQIEAAYQAGKTLTCKLVISGSTGVVMNLTTVQRNTDTGNFIFSGIGVVTTDSDWVACYVGYINVSSSDAIVSMNPIPSDGNEVRY